MARRSAQNPRYRKDNLGTTRKSAASAKPKRSAGEKQGSGSSSSSKKKSTASTRPSGWRGFFAPLPTPDTPEFKRWRKIWGGFFVAGVVFTALSLFQWETRIGVWLLVAAYTCLFSAIYIDFTKIRRMRRAYADELEGTASPKDKKKDLAAKDKKDSAAKDKKDSAAKDKADSKTDSKTGEKDDSKKGDA